MANSLNKALKHTQGKYIAVLDADDISLPERLNKQFAFMESNPDIGLLGTWCLLINASGQQIDTIMYPNNNRTNRSNLWISLLKKCGMYQT